jgi:hypothetical protein
MVRFDVGLSDFRQIGFLIAYNISFRSAKKCIFKYKSVIQMYN